MHRFFVPPESISDGSATLTGDQARQIARVLRLSSGDTIILLDNSGQEFDVVLTAVSTSLVECDVTQQRSGLGEPDIKITLFQSLLKGENFELVLQKGTELGVTRFVPVITERTIVRAPEGRRAASKMNRWQRIVTEAAEQSRRARIPEISTPLSFNEACILVSHLALMPWEEEQTLSLRDALSASKSEVESDSGVSLIIGPEGGFSSQEAELARHHGVQTVSLGRRILRAETAAIAAVTAVCYELGEWEL
jgi:16S rRNA (uracil1498-N3)-methyltransferase